jgi:hypothetical protein
MMAALFAGSLRMCLLLTLCLQEVERHSPVKTGLAFLPLPKSLARYRPRWRTSYANTDSGATSSWVHHWSQSAWPGPASCRYTATTPLHVLPGLLIAPIGYGMSFAHMYAAATARVLGHFSGLITTSQQMGGEIGLAILSGVVATRPARSLTTQPRRL